MNEIHWEEVKPDTIARTIWLALVLINQALAICGKEKIPITESEIYQLVTLIATIVTAVWTWWKNNSFTRAAIKADEYMYELKAGDKEVS